MYILDLSMTLIYLWVAVRINRTALEKDALEVKSVDFSIEMMDNTPDLIDMLTYKFSLDVTQNIKV